MAVYRKLFGIPYSYCKGNYSKTISTNNFEIIPEDILPDTISQFDNISRLAPCDLLDKCQD